VVRPGACRPEPSCVGPASDTIDGERRSQGGLQPWESRRRHKELEPRRRLWTPPDSYAVRPGPFLGIVATWLASAFSKRGLTSASRCARPKGKDAARCAHTVLPLYPGMMIRRSKECI
jgi:hypothetical protein